jgi:hypothetical protein
MVFLSDVDVNLESQLKKYNLAQKAEENYIFYKIDDALHHAEKIIGANK